MRRTIVALSFFGVFLLGLAGCGHIQLVSSYDPIFNELVSDLHVETEKFLVKMERNVGKPAGAYEANRDFYDQAQAMLNVMDFRAQSREKNEETIKQVEILREAFLKLEQRHEAKADQGLPQALLVPYRDTLRAQFKAILILEHAKLRGKDK